jgi:hypothetical protein
MFCETVDQLACRPGAPARVCLVLPHKCPPLALAHLFPSLSHVSSLHSFHISLHIPLLFLLGGGEKEVRMGEVRGRGGSGCVRCARVYLFVREERCCSARREVGSLIEGGLEKND